MPRPLPLVAVVGPTGTGKSDLAVEVALALDADVVNADASQLYRGMDIGTAKLTLQARRGVRHHQLDVLEISEAASVAAYQRAARADIDSITTGGRAAVLVGGSGLYVKAVLDPLEFPGTDPAVRERVEAYLQAEGPRATHARLAGLDPAAAAQIHPANTRRVVRALEVIELTGRAFSATLPRSQYVRPTLQIGLRRETVELDEALAARVHAMMDAGLLAEVERLVDRGLRESRTARTALGYAQLLDHLAGSCTLDAAVDATISATRAFARRQVKWFRRDERIRWLPAPTSPEQVRALAGEVVRIAHEHALS